VRATDGEAQWSGKPWIEQFNVNTPAHARRKVEGRLARRASCQQVGQNARRWVSINNIG
jgi:hypothetical protein